MPGKISRSLRFLAVLAVFILAGCGAPTTLVPTETAAPLPTSTPTIAPTASALAWTDPTSNVQLQIPPDWQAGETPAQMKGEDGFVSVDFSQVDTVTLDQVCILNANNIAFGAQPKIERTVVGNLDACQIFPSSDRAEATGDRLVIDLGTNRKVTQRFLQITVDPVHFQEVTSSLSLLSSASAAVTPAPMQTLQSPATEDINPVTYTVVDLTLEEYPIVSASVDTPSHLDFRQRIPPTVFARRDRWRGYDTTIQLKEANQRLTPFDVQINPASSYQILHAGGVLLDQVSDFSFISLSDSGQRFAFFATTSDGTRFLVTNDGALPLKDTTIFTDYDQPVFMGEELLTLRFLPDSNAILVQQGDSLVYRLYVPQPTVSMPIHAFASDQGHWYLEVSGLLIRDGVMVNTQLDASEIFGFSLLNGKPFYFYRQGDQVFISYDDVKVTPLSATTTFEPYNDVIHDQCCEPAMFNVSANSIMVWFYALKGGTWYYVELGIYP